MTQKILFITGDDYAILTHRLPLVKMLQNKGFKIYVMANPTGAGAKLQAEGIEYIPIKMKRGGLNPLRDLWVICQYFWVMLTLRPQLVHAVAIKPCLYGAIAARLAHIPILGAMGGLGFTFMSNTFKARIIRPVVRIIFAIFYNHQRAKILVQNMDDYREFIHNIGLPPTQMELLPGAGVNIDRFDRPHNPPPDSPIRVVMMARLLADKGIWDVVEAMKLLDNKRIEIHIYGTIDPQNPTSLNNQELAQLKKNSAVQFMGHGDPLNAYQGAHIALLPSYREGMPMALMEAAAMGIALISNDVPGCRDICRDGINGILVEKQQPAQLARAIEKLANDKDLRTQYGNNGYEMTRTIFAHHIINQQTLAIYNTLWGQGHAK